MLTLAVASKIPTGLGRTHDDAPAAFHPIIARCPGCAADVAHPVSRACDRIGCPVKHLGHSLHGSNV